MCKTDTLTVCSPTGQLATINLYKGKQQIENMTVKQLKKEAVKKFPRFAVVVVDPHSLDNVRLTCEGKPLDDDASLSEYGIKPTSVVQMVTKVDGG